MSSPQDLEKGVLSEDEHGQEYDQEREAGTRRESISAPSDTSKNPSQKNDASSNASFRDSNREEVEAMDQGYLDDLERQKVRDQFSTSHIIEPFTNSPFSCRLLPSL